jgi:prevent-host-death family protein
MVNEVVNIHAAKTKLSQLVKRAERGERITIARNGKPVAQIGPAPRARRPALPADDPLLNLETFAVAGRKPARGRDRDKLTNDEIDRILYGKP